MQFNITKFFALASATAIVCSNAATVDKRDANSGDVVLAQVFLEVNRGGASFNINHLNIPTGCVDFASPFIRTISSVEVFSGVVCTFFTAASCGGNGPTIGNLFVNLPGTPFDNAITSYSCISA